MRSCVVAIVAAVIAVAGVRPALAQVEGQWSVTLPMQSPREMNAQVPLKGGNALTIGGVDANGNVLASAEIYTAAHGSWSLTGAMQAAREVFPAVALTSGKVLVAGGLGTGGVILGSAELFDPATNAWSSAGSLSVARYGHSATLLPNGTVLVTGGCVSSGCATLTTTSEIYNPTTNSWSGTGSLTTARSYHAAVRLKSGQVLAIGGYAGGALQSTELYDPSTGMWSAAASTNVARYLNGTTLLPDGKILVTGGVITKYPLNSAELYDPTANSWTSIASMTAGRYAHSSTLLADGTVLLGGGVSQSISCGRGCVGYIPTASTEIFTEATESFAAAAGLSRALAYQATTALASGQDLVNGGMGFNAYCCQVVSDSEFYTPLTLSFSAYSLNFNYLQLGLTSAAQNVTVTNVSTHATSFKGIAASGDFSQSNDCPVTLAPGQSCVISASFTPTRTGSRTGAVTLRDSDPGSPKQNIALAGIGETLALAFSPSSLSLGSVAVGSSSTQSASLINDGAAAVSLTAITIAPANSTFTQTNNCPASLAVQQSCSIQITFRPPDVLNYSATLSVANNAGAPATLTLSGTGLDGP